jgi:hypothetical protein
MAYNKKLIIRLSNRQYEGIKAFCDRHDIKVSEFIRSHINKILAGKEKESRLEID